MVPLSRLNQEVILDFQLENMVGLEEAKPTKKWGPPFYDNP